MEYVAKAKLDDLDDFTRAYLEAAEWSGLAEEDSEALESSVEPSWDARSLRQAGGDCAGFRLEAGRDLDEWSPAEAGHDFWLTRNHHGAGFWDRGRQAGDTLTAFSHHYSEVYVSFDAASETLMLDS